MPQQVAVVLPPQRPPGEALRILPSQFLALKRVCDVVLSAAALIVLAPLLLGVAVAIKATSPGPVFYRQERMGKDGRHFWMWKFRTMRVGADAELDSLQAGNSRAGIGFKLRGDPRVTPVGRFLRKTAIDELPQLVNILAGDMAIVGPRPLPIYEAVRCTPEQDARLAVRPGLTCFWQVVKDVDFDERMRMDVSYVHRMGIRVDALLIWRTILFLAHGKGDT
ncbi:MAG: sugar transferase [Propionibacteriaceae bacterium]|jgi:lipopolysaccharide/colanic/teichoic acid biosynthesis glycosyltransferase|nr:sugar transferase [Propionibacteriaceae bacterium]